MLRTTTTGKQIFSHCKVFSLFHRSFSDEFSLTDLLYDNELDNVIASQKVLDSHRGPTTSVSTIGICGAPNSGKSTLLNNLVGKKLSAVSHKVNTTRESVLGVRNVDNTQLIFLDTPGILQKSGSSREEKELTGVARNALSKANTLVTIIDASIPLTYLSKEVIRTTSFLAHQYQADLIFALNKVDLVKKKALLEERKKEIAMEIPSSLLSSVNVGEDGNQVMEISAVSGTGISELISRLVNLSKPGQWHYSDGMVTNRTPEEQACEVIREKVFHYLNQEIPYEMIIEHLGWEKNQSGKLVLKQKLIVEVQTPSKQRIVTKLKRRIESAAGKDLCTLFGRQIHLDLSVVVEKRT